MKTLAACLLVAALFAVVLAIGLSRLPKQVLYVEYGSGKCLAADVVRDNEWHRITCDEFKAIGGYDEPYEKQWGGRPQ